MQRRKFVVGLGSLAAGGGAVMGTGAFAVDAENREATGTIESDANAYLSLEPGQYSSIRNTDGELTVNLDRLNANAVTILEDVFYIENTGNGDVNVSITDISSTRNEQILSVPVTSNGSGDILSGSERVSTGTRIGVGIKIETGDDPDGASNTVNFHVDADPT
jgi:hypothetical protein